MPCHQDKNRKDSEHPTRFVKHCELLFPYQDYTFVFSAKKAGRGRNSVIAYTVTELLRPNY